MPESFSLAGGADIHKSRLTAWQDKSGSVESQTRQGTKGLSGFSKLNLTRIVVAAILLVTLLVGLMLYFDLHKQLLELLVWFDEQGIWAPLLFVLLMALVVVFLVPGVLLTTGAGFVFGALEGTLYVVIGSTLGAGIAFLLSRHLLGTTIREKLLSHAKLNLVIEALVPHGWKIVLLTRLIPFFPGKISNYAFGAVPVSFTGFIVGSFVGFIPFSLHNAYLGSLAANLATLGQRSADWQPWQWGLYGLGFLVTLFGLYYINRLARRALARYATKTRET
ncbi:TVP38/TMEM64 family protein [Bowmanella dokdonensis]|uniref:TVP38/TMEM64 family membrane protein n=1 Tax=Bowmanella dokdonensis TaxID=751969 RepID=A0A939DPH0_9ALTE|nr:TVP38/TMEM64 family protein [Bowmanella dokdonensis]MBN7826563.1 TVP38/TMEM64 family protein [Bowmanella dokdonensis]